MSSQAEIVRHGHARNVDALREAADLAIEGVTTIIRRNNELLRAGVEQSQSLLNGLARAPSPEARLALQAAAASTLLEQSITNGRELAEIALRSGHDAVDVLSRRFRDGLAETVALVAPKGRP
jgi:phasin family protein